MVIFHSFLYVYQRVISGAPTAAWATCDHRYGMEAWTRQASSCGLGPHLTVMGSGPHLTVMGSDVSDITSFKYIYIYMCTTIYIYVYVFVYVYMEDTDITRYIYDIYIYRCI